MMYPVPLCDINWTITITCVFRTFAQKDSKKWSGERDGLGRPLNTAAAEPYLLATVRSVPTGSTAVRVAAPLVFLPQLRL